MKYIFSLLLFVVSFFPAYLGYKTEWAWVGLLCTIGIWLSTIIPFVKVYWNRWLFAFVILSIFGYVIESIGVVTCFPYWCFAYSEQMGAKLFHLVPIALAFTWPPLVIAMWSIVKYLQSRFLFANIVLIITWAIGLVLVDLILDPIAVVMWLRSYTQSQWWWFWVPWTNFAGRLLSGTIWISILNITLPKRLDVSIFDRSLWLTLAFFTGFGFRTVLLDL